MPDATPRRWSRWRIAHTSPQAARLRFAAPHTPGAPDRGEQPGADGIRHGLVERVRREIAAGTYDTEEKWLAAEAELLRRIEERM